MSALDEHLRRHRKRLIDRERAAFREMLIAYQQIDRELRRSIRDLGEKIRLATAAGETISEGWLMREHRLATLINEVKDQIDRFGQTATAITRREQLVAIQIAIGESNELLRLMTSSLDVPITARINPRFIEDAVGMMGDGSPIIDYYRKNLAPKVAEAIRVEVTKGVALGTDFRTIANRLVQTGQITRSRALMVARTEVNRVRREATREQYRENSDIISGWEWVASKSRRTCPACLALDGRQFTLDDEFPQHPNCRCTMIAVLIDVPRPPRERGSEWLARQDGEIKAAVLGTDAAAAIERGEIELADLVGWRNSKEFGRSVYTKGVSAALLTRRPKK